MSLAAGGGMDIAGGEIEARVEASRAGPRTLRIGGRLVHSAYEPEREARELSDAIVSGALAKGARGLLVIGSGLGHLVRRLREAARLPVLVWEPFPELAAAVAADALCEVEAADQLAPALRDAFGSDPRCVVVPHPGYSDLVRFEQRHAHRLLQPAGPSFPLIASRRALDSLARLARLRPITELGDCLRGRTAIVASGGPSLDAALPALAARSGGVLLAAPQALERLLRARVRVDFVVNPDPGDLLTPVLGASAAPYGALLADTASHPAVLDRAPERTFLFHLRGPQLHERAWEQAGLPLVDEAFVTVSETAVWLARALGARRLLLAGVDYASATEAYGGSFRVPSASGERCRTNPAYFHGARYLEALLAADPGLEVRRLGDGVRVRGAASITPDALPGWLASEPELVLPTGGGACDALTRAVHEIVSCDPPAMAAAVDSPYPAHAPWLDFAPLDSERLSQAWAELRATCAAERAGSRCASRRPRS